MSRGSGADILGRFVGIGATLFLNDKYSGFDNVNSSCFGFIENPSVLY
jgi:hypothetical protein